MRSWVLVLTAIAFTATGCRCHDGHDNSAAADAGAPAAGQHTARLVFVAGEVQVKRADSLEWSKATIGQLLGTDDKVRTLRNSFATIEFTRGGRLRVGPESLVAVTDLRFEPRSELRKATFMLYEGEIDAEVAELRNPESEFRIRTPSAEASVLHREVSFQ